MSEENVEIARRYVAAFNAHDVEGLLNYDPDETVIGAKKIKGTKAMFTFSSSEPGSTPEKYRQLSSGKQKFKVRAIDAQGNIDSSPAKKKFTI